MENLDLIPSPPKTPRLAEGTDFQIPPLDGSLTLPQIYDWQLHNSPNHRLFVFSDSNGAVRNITWKEAIAAIYTGARSLRSRIQNVVATKHRVPVVAILSSADAITYFTTLMCVLRADCIVFPISPRNSAAAVAHLLGKVGVDHVLVGREAAMQDLIVESLAKLKETSPSQPSPTYSPTFIFDEIFLPSFEEALVLKPDELPLTTQSNDPVLYLHSSGSTALPKPIPFTNKKMIQIGQIPWFGEQDWTGKVLSVHVMPMYHGMGVSQLAWAATAGLVVAGFEPKVPSILPTPDNLFEGARSTSSDIILCVPSFLEAWARRPDYVSWLASRSGVIYGGGPLNREAGDYMTRQGVSIFILYGMSEVGILSPMLPARTEGNYDWSYFRFTDWTKNHWKPHGDDLYELIIVDHPYCTPSIINTQVDGIPAYATSDLFIPHPTKSGYWRIHGRVDDQIVHTTGEKTNPGPLENLLNQDPHVATAVMFGHGRFNAGVLIEPKPAFRFDPADEKKLEEFRNAVWPSIERMNEFAPQHSRLFKEMILVGSPSKPFTYTAKNTARRQAIIRDYDEEISKIYEIVSETTQSEISPPTSWNLGSTTSFVRAVVASVLTHAVKDEDDLFQHGCDSLQATWIRNSVLRALKDAAGLDSRLITNNFVYEHPTINRLSMFVFSLAVGGMAPAPLDDEAKKLVMHELLERYSRDFPASRPGNAARVHGSEKVVLLTGSTGSLGSYVLHSLIKDPAVKHVYVLNRSHKEQDTVARLRKSFEQRGLDASELVDDKVTVLEADLSDEKALGLEDTEFRTIQDTVTHIVDVAWRVDFNLNVISFRTNLKSMRNLVDIAIRQGAHYTFASTLSVCRNSSEPSAREELMPPEASLGNGYSESKWVAEHIIARATSSTGLRASIIRVGQLSGGLNGSWMTKEWLPSLIHASALMKCIPDDDRVVSWIPLHVAGKAVVDLLGSSAPPPGDSDNLAIFHLIHPKPVPWTTLARSFSQKLGASLVPYPEWLRSLEESSTRPGSESLNAVTILDFYKSVSKKTDLKEGCEAFGMPILDVERTVKASGVLGDERLAQLGEKDASQWLGYWRSVGLVL
ncbi:putative NRPS-like protein biosynthetic cluster [Marasmius oreades]|uniref:NRPS-like protein biosynthetic cluster n=1 Tax=Marasmius oreades TaxID=181124 RepID=A0A9P7UT32_9AGAR|nr:putative NRPS-like protein biosynthetic cluster [Marasmius oreades]KAG7091816.1 putative NRPS-like protein biosynthetic cluster [Marasmius oreades]